MSPEKTSESYKDPDWIYDQYINKDKTIAEIAKEFGYSKSTIARYKDRFGFRKKKSSNIKKYADPEWLRAEYIDKNKSILTIAEEQCVNRCVISEYVIRYNLQKSDEDKTISKSNRIKKVCDRKYDGVHFNSTKEVLDKREATNLQRYGKKTYLGSDAHRQDSDLILIKDKTPYEWSMEKDISNIILYRWISNNPGYTENQFLNFLDNYEKNITDIENIFRQEADLNHYDKFFDLENYPKLRYKPDFKISNSIGINIDGLYWHSDLHKDNDYHFKMRLEYENRGLRIIQIRGDEIRFKLPIVKSMIKNIKGDTKFRIGARKTKIFEVTQDEASKFLKNNHMMGSIKAKHIGLYQGSDLVMIFSYKIYNKIMKVERLCSRVDTQVAGGFSKLLSYCRRNLQFSKIHYWVDLRYGTGNFLLSQGFKHSKDTLGWKWTDFKNTYNRLRCRANMDERGLTQKEHAAELGWVKIYDAGQRLYIGE